MTTMNQFDPGDYVEACDVPGCPARYGLGDHDHGPCVFCGGEADMRVVLEGKDRPICADCYAKDSPDVSLDYTVTVL